ncbi:MAG: biotin transporter BioY [Candidatus Zixiibacteriota bacterium]|nr:MAG: biotin transporter BioY [candidate division Zixibacteria bacterium]
MTASAYTAVLHARDTLFVRLRAATLLQKIALVLGFAALTGLAAQVRIPLPFTPVPVTAQTVVVLLSGVLLGARGGAAAQALYVGLGAAGLPWFAGLQGGHMALLGPTGGYLLGFILAAGFTGWCTDRWSGFRRLPGLLGLTAFSGLVLVYLPGLLQLGFWMVLGGIPVTLDRLLALGLLPFLAGDAVKIAAAALLARALRGAGR